MDRTAWIAVSFCVLALIGWQVYIARQIPPPRPAMVSASATPTQTAEASASVAPLPSATPAAMPSAAPEFAEKRETLRNSDFEVHLTNRGGAISDVVLLNHVGDKNEPLVLNSEARTPVAALVDDPANEKLDEFTSAAQPDGSIVYERKAPEGVTTTKHFFVPPPTEKKDNFVLRLDVQMRNDGTQPYTNPGYFITLGSAHPIHANDWAAFTALAWYAGAFKQIDVNWFAEQTVPIVGIKRRDAQQFYHETPKGGAEWAAVSSQFFATIVTPLNAKGSEIEGSRFDSQQGTKTPIYGIEGALHMPAVQLQPGQTATAQFQIWAGPKLYGRLAKLEHNEAEIMNFGIFKLICQALLNFLNLLHSFLGNYALAILALTTVIKLCLWPLQNKANRSMRQMQSLNPKMQELREKYKDDPTRMNSELMKLYKQYGVNPVGGCLPMVIQIPIFFGLFTMLRQAVELRNASFLWVHDLSQPDTVGHVPGIGWPINVLPLLMGGTQLWLFQMTPKTGDPTQRRVAMFTPLIFLFFCYNFAAALALYYTVQNLFTILQLWLNQRQPVPALEKVQPPGKQRKR
ncbi:MAG: membrane protein insertase YidC [Chthoniobacterales bacterium]